MIRAKKLVALMLAMVMFFVLSATAIAAPPERVITGADGNAYFYFWASDLKVENYMAGYSVNGSDPIYFDSNFAAKTERIDKNLLKPGQINTFTIFTGNSDGKIDESLSRKEAGTSCGEFSIITTALNLVLPNGTIAREPKVYSYAPADETTPLKNISRVENTESRIYLGDDTLAKNWKIDICFDLTNVSWDPSEDIAPMLPAVKNVSLQIGANPAERNITWYSLSKNASVAELAEKTEMTSESFPANKQTFSAASELTGLTGYTSYKTTMTGLSPNTEYVYRVGNNTDGWSEIYSFKTENFNGNFSFVAVADPQLGQGTIMRDINLEIAAWEKTLGLINTYCEDAAFLTCLGDQVSESCIESHYDAFFAPKLLKSYALAVIAGNHDYGANYTPHYNMPNVSALGKHNSMGYGSGDYYYTYGDALFMVVNANCKTNTEHTQFLEETVNKHPDAKWKILMFHEGAYGSSDQRFRNEYIENLRKELTPCVAKLGIDVVLNGHEHSYARSYLINENGEPNMSTGGNSITDPDIGEALYVTLGSATGTDYCNVATNVDLSYLAVKVEAKFPKFTKVDVTDSSLTVTTYNVNNMDIVDSYTINRTLFVSPESTSVKAGESLKFSAEVYGEASQEVEWSISGNESDKTTISTDGVLSLDIDEMAETITVTATSKADSSKSAVATVTVESSATNVNVGLGVKYTLPSNITWKDASGNTVTYADTSKPGYRFYTGTANDSTKVKYRINVGEYKTLMEEDLENFPESEYTTKFAYDIKDENGKAAGYITKQSYKEKTDEQQIMKDGDNTVAAFGPNLSSLNSFMWVPSDKASGEAFNVSFKLRVDSLDLATVEENNSTAGYLFTANFGNVAGVNLRVTVKDNKITRTDLICSGTSAKTADISNFVEWTTPDSENKVSMKNYITVALEGNNVQYGAKVNGNEVADSVAYRGVASLAEFNSLRVAKRSFVSGYPDHAMVYMDDFVYSKAVYVTERIKKIPVNATLYQGDSSSQTAVAALKMSDGSTKNFTVNYVADTSTDGVKTATGTIDGFDDSLTVTYTVKPKQAVNVGLGVTYMLPETMDSNSVTWKDASGNTVKYADTSKVGYRFYTGTLADSTEVIYRVNVGEYKTLMEDNLESYPETAYKTAYSYTHRDKNNKAIVTLSKKEYKEKTDEQQIMKDGDNTVAAFGPNISSLNSFMWIPDDKASGEAFSTSFKLRVDSLDLATVKENSSSAGYLFTANFGNVAGVILRVVVKDKKITKTELLCSGNTAKTADISNFVEWTTPDSNNLVSMKNYITVELEGNNVQYAAKVNGNEVANSVPYKDVASLAEFHSLRVAKRSFVTDYPDNAMVYMDDFVYSKAIYVDGNINETSVETTVTRNDAPLQTASVALQMSDGSTKNFTVSYVADTSTDGVKTATGTIDGFDDSLTVTYTVVTPTVITAIENSDGKTQVKLQNNIELEESAKLFVVVYNKESGEIKKLCSAILDNEQRNAGNQTVTLPEDILTDATNSIVKAYIWNKQLKPLN